MKTPQVADLLGVKYWTIVNLLRARKIAAPPKDSSGDYIWGKGDIEAARRALAERGWKK